MYPLLLLSLVAALAVPQATQESKQERPRVPDDSIELLVIGCLKGRVLTTVANRQRDVEVGPFVGSRHFRLAGKREVMDDVKKHNGHLVEVVGIVKRSALDDKGVKIGSATVRPASPPSSAGRMPNPADNVDVMDATSVRLRSTSCGSEDR
jgi:hypothetical protein